MAGKLLLLPNLLDDRAEISRFLPLGLAEAIQQLSGLFCESQKAARSYLRKFISHEAMQKVMLVELNEHKLAEPALLIPIERGEIWGILSDAGLPCLADPGADLVWQAHQRGVAVETFVGPSALIFALQLSGFSGQRFAFHGYLPKEPSELEAKIKELEKRAVGETQIWIEAPYRSEKMHQFLKTHLQGSTRLCIAVSLTAPLQKVFSQTVADWRKNQVEFGKEPAVFLIYREKT